MHKGEGGPVFLDPPSQIIEMRSPIGELLQRVPVHQASSSSYDHTGHAATVSAAHYYL